MRADEEKQFEEYAVVRIPVLRRIAYLMCGDWHLAEDAVSTALTKVYLSWERIRTLEHVDAYVRQILVRAVVDERRRPWRRESPTEVSEYSLPPVGGDTVDDRIVLRAALEHMPPRRRAVIVLRYFVGLSVEETAAAMGINTGTVKSQTARALSTLRELLPAGHLGSDREVR